ncbi:hypothetical protein [Psychrobacter urativorans]|nr:hypothetical protein [Psychrobacter urativorans]
MSQTTSYVLVLYYSNHCTTETLAYAIAQGRRLAIGTTSTTVLTQADWNR